MKTPHETPDESIDRLRSLLIERKMRDQYGDKHMIDDDDSGNAIAGLRLPFLLLTAFVGGMILGAFILHLITR
jgi:F0F1-type ATP synthase assembly protein I